MGVVKLLYRELLTVGKKFDRNAMLRAFVSSDLLRNPMVRSSQKRLPHIETYNKYILEYLQKKSFYMPSKDRQSMQSIIKKAFRIGTKIGSTTFSSTQTDTVAASTSIDTGMMALRELNDLIAFANEIGVIGNKKNNRNRGFISGTAGNSGKMSAPTTSSKLLELIQSVHLTDEVKTGTFLISHPMLTGIFSRSVILLLEHQEKKGTKGFIINHPTKDALISSFRVPARILGTFGSNKIRVGGPVRTRHAELLHGTPSIGGHCITANNFSKEDKVFWGGDLEVAAKAVEEKQMLPKDLMFISGMSTWVPGQLENELQRGTWISVTAPLTIALDANKDLWQVLLKTLGKEYEAWSQIPQLPEDDDRL